MHEQWPWWAELHLPAFSIFMKAVFFPIWLSALVESHPVSACSAGRALHTRTSGSTADTLSWMGMYHRLFFTPVRNHSFWHVHCTCVLYNNIRVWWITWKMVGVQQQPRVCLRSQILVKACSHTSSGDHVTIFSISEALAKDQLLVYSNLIWRCVAPLFTEENSKVYFFCTD